MTDEIVIRRPDDFLNTRLIMNPSRRCTWHTSRVFARALVMPNTRIPITDAFLAREYARSIVSRLRPSEDGARFYGLPLNEGEIRLVRKPWEVPTGDPMPFMAGETLQWGVEHA